MHFVQNTVQDFHVYMMLTQMVAPLMGWVQVIMATDLFSVNLPKG